MRNKSLVMLFAIVALLPVAFASAQHYDGISPQWLDKSESLDSKLALNIPSKQKLSQDQLGSKGSWLPFWGDEAKRRGYELPKPFGININYINIQQGIKVDNVQFSDLGMGAIVLPSTLFDIQVGKTQQSSKTRTIKLDAWVLPFLNIYALAGHTQGNSLSTISVDSDPAHFSGFDKVVAQVIHNLYQNGELQNISFELDFKGVTYGVGTTLAGGYQNWFSLLDTNYTETQLDVLDGRIKAMTVSPRLGYRFATPAIKYLKLEPGKLNVWIGGMYQNIQQEFKGSLSDLTIPRELQTLIELADHNGNGRFDITQHLESPWNILVGMQYEMTHDFNIVTEWGFTERNSFFISGEYRF